MAENLFAQSGDDLGLTAVRFFTLRVYRFPQLFLKMLPSLAQGRGLLGPPGSAIHGTQKSMKLHGKRLIFL